MKKVFLFTLLLTIFTLVSITAESWEDYKQRAYLMERNFGDGIGRGHWSTWSYDKWGALMATTYWLEGAWENIYLNAPNLSQYEINTFKQAWQRRRSLSDDMMKVLNIAVESNSGRKTIVDRWKYWENHLYNGGTIIFN